MMIKYVFFDLDGTLTDPVLGITNSILYALEKMGKPLPPREELYCFIGPPLVFSFQEYLGMTKEEAETAVVYYREHFSVTGLLENTPYDGVGEMLKELRDSGYTLCIATSKPEPFAVRILEHFGLAQYFAIIAGSTLDASRNTKTAVLEYLIDSIRKKFSDSPSSGTPVICAGEESPDSSAHSTPVICAMVGDRHHDIDGAKDVGIPSVGVLWGYGSEEELRSAGADYVVPDMNALVETVKKM